MSLATRLQESFQAFQAADHKYNLAQNKRNPRPNEVADAAEARTVATAALNEVAAILRREEVLIINTLEQVRAFTQFLSQFPDCGNLSRVEIAGNVDERTSARICQALRMAGFGAPTRTFSFPD